MQYLCQQIGVWVRLAEIPSPVNLTFLADRLLGNLAAIFDRNIDKII
jgi:hypothetical protein